MTTISSAGSAEGVDLTKVMSNASLARLNAGALPVSQPEYVAEISYDGMQQSAITALSEAASQLTSKPLWTSTVASSSDPEIVDARSNTQTPAGVYQIEVEQLASPQVTSTHTFSSLSTVVGLGTLNIEMGSWNVPPTTFAANPNWPKATVVLGPRNDTLDRVRDKINAAGLGVVATVVSDATGSRLVLRSTGTGANNGFKITTDEAMPSATQDAAALSALGFDPSSMEDVGMKLQQAAGNARAKINGDTVESSLNAIDSPSGLSLVLKKPADAPVTISVAPDRAGMQQAAQNFAQTYNALQKLGGSVAGEVRHGTENLLGPNDRPTELGRVLMRIGVARTSSGELQIDTQKMASALEEEPVVVRQSQTMLAQQVLADLPARQSERQADESFLPQPNSDLTVGSSSRIAGALLRQRLLDQYQDTSSQNVLEVGEPSSLRVTSRS